MDHCDYEYEILRKDYKYAYFIWIIVYKSTITRTMTIPNLEVKFDKSRIVSVFK
jgi:hypothetical protein